MVFGSIKLCETCDPHVFSDNFPFPIRKGNSAADYHIGHQYVNTAVAYHPGSGSAVDYYAVHYSAVDYGNRNYYVVKIMAG